MRSPRKLAAALVAAIAISAVTATSASAQTPLGQDIAWSTITRTTYGGQATAKQVVIKTEADYKAFFGGNPPATPKVDFSTEDVLAVCMGTQPTGGYGIEIVRVFTNVGGVVGGMGFVHVQEMRPAPGTIVTMALTAPMHVVKVARKVTSYSFANVNPGSTVGAAPTSFDLVSLTYNRPITSYTSTVEVDASGKVRVLQASPTAKYAPVDGQATAAELKQLGDAWKNADVTTLPADIPDPRVFIVAPDNLKLGSQAGGKSYETSAHVGWYDPYTARVEPLVKALEAIRDRVLKGPAAASFDKLTLSLIGGFAPLRETITVDKAGLVTVDRTWLTVGPPNLLVSDKATAAELAKIQSAFAAADVATLPASIDAPVVIMDIPSLRIESSVGATTYTSTVVKAGFYDTYEARVKPLVEAVQAVRDRIVAANQPRVLSGWVSVQGQNVKLGSYTIPQKSSLRSTIASGKGRWVTINATMTAGGYQIDEVKSVIGYANTWLALRKSPYSWSSSVATLKKGEKLEVLDRSWAGNYYKATAAGETGWVWRPGVTIGSTTP